MNTIARYLIYFYGIAFFGASIALGVNFISDPESVILGFPLLTILAVTAGFMLLNFFVAGSLSLGIKRKRNKQVIEENSALHEKITSLENQLAKAKSQ